MIFDKSIYNIIDIQTDEPLPIFIVENLRNCKSFGIHLERGFGNGYICLPNWHPFYKKDYNNINVNIHGGLTFSELDDENDMWVIGFNTSHSNDNLKNCSLDYVKEQCIYLQQQCLDLKEVKRIRKINKLSKLINNERN